MTSRAFPGRDPNPGRPTFALPPSVRPVSDAPAEWLGRVRPWERGDGVRLHSIMPGGFDSYVRVLHPAYHRGNDSPIRWAEVAARAGTRLHPLAYFDWLAGPSPHDWDEPLVGQLPEAAAKELVAVLREFTTTDRCYLCIWDGYGSYVADAGTMQVSIPNRTYAVFNGSLDSVLELADEGNPVEGPNLWCPADRAWCCATEVDFVSTYVGAGRACAEQILATPGLEVFPVPADTRVDMGADIINARR